MWPTATERLLVAKGVPRVGSCLLALVAHFQTCFCSILDVLPSDDCFQGSSILSLIVDQSDSNQFMQLMLMCHRILSFQLQSC